MELHELRLRSQVLTKMREMKIRDFSEEELGRVFEGCSRPVACTRYAKMLITKEGLSLQELYSKYVDR